MRKYLMPFFAVAALFGAGAAQAQTVNVNVYGDTTYLFYRETDPNGKVTADNSSFSLPRATTLLSASQGNLSVTNENTFTVSLVGGGNTFTATVERFEIAYQVAEWLRLKAGRLHTALGYYNDAFHSGYYYQLVIDRPAFVNFEEGGGLIPSRMIGIHADGRIPAGVAGAFRYDLDFGNGRGATMFDTNNLRDPDVAKAFNVRLRWEPKFLDGLIIGANYYRSAIAASSQVVGQNPSTGAPVYDNIPKMTEQDYGAHIAYLEGNFHVLAEGMIFTHSVNGTSTTYTSKGAYAEVGYAIGDVTPYVEADRIDMSSVTTPTGQIIIDDPYFAYSVAGSLGNLSRGTIGAKWQFCDGLALKAAFGKYWTDGGGSLYFAGAQAAVAF